MSSGMVSYKTDANKSEKRVYKTVMRPAMLNQFELVALKKRQEAEVEVAELRMLKFALGMNRLGRIRNEYT